MAFNDPNTIAMNDLDQVDVDLTQLGFIAFSKHTVQRKRCSFKVYVNAYCHWVIILRRENASVLAK